MLHDTQFFNFSHFFLLTVQLSFAFFVLFLRIQRSKKKEKRSQFACSFGCFTSPFSFNFCFDFFLGFSARKEEKNNNNKKRYPLICWFISFWSFFLFVCFLFSQSCVKHLFSLFFFSRLYQEKKDRELRRNWKSTVQSFFIFFKIFFSSPSLTADLPWAVRQRQKILDFLWKSNFSFPLFFYFISFLTFNVNLNNNNNNKKKI